MCQSQRRQNQSKSKSSSSTSSGGKKKPKAGVAVDLKVDAKVPKPDVKAPAPAAKVEVDASIKKPEVPKPSKSKSKSKSKSSSSSSSDKGGKKKGSGFHLGIGLPKLSKPKGPEASVKKPEPAVKVTADVKVAAKPEVPKPKVEADLSLKKKGSKSKHHVTQLADFSVDQATFQRTCSQVRPSQPGVHGSQVFQVLLKRVPHHDDVVNTVGPNKEHRTFETNSKDTLSQFLCCCGELDVIPGFYYISKALKLNLRHALLACLRRVTPSWFFRHATYHAHTWTQTGDGPLWKTGEKNKENLREHAGHAFHISTSCRHDTLMKLAPLWVCSFRLYATVHQAYQVTLFCNGCNNSQVLDIGPALFLGPLGHYFKNSNAQSFFSFLPRTRRCTALILENPCPRLALDQFRQHKQSPTLTCGIYTKKHASTTHAPLLPGTVTCRTTY
ncbi:hypothetical protein Pelo_2201 [Pelomyxa schiedti]|nr:hypothetical protein Pelo_2201 [Pelomyxa schiedti]